MITLKIDQYTFQLTLYCDVHQNNSHFLSDDELITFVISKIYLKLIIHKFKYFFLIKFKIT